MIEVIGYMVIGVVFAMVLPILKAWAESKDTWVGLTEQDRKNIHAMWVETDELTDEQDVIDVVEIGRAHV